MRLKQLDKLKKYLKLVNAYPSYMQLFTKIKKESNNRCVLIGTPIHGNLGDSLIAQQCLVYLNRKYDSVLEIPEFFYELFSWLFFFVFFIN